MGTLHEDQYIFLIVCHSVSLRMKNASHTSCTKNQNKYFILSNVFPKTLSFMR